MAKIIPNRDLIVPKAEVGEIKIFCPHDALANTIDCIPHEYNPNEHSKEQISEVVKSIKANGFRNPIIISTLSKKMIAGHCRREAAFILGMDKVPVVYQDFASEQDEYKFLNADNETQRKSKFNEKVFIKGLEELNFDMNEIDFSDFGIPDFSLLEPEDDEEEDSLPAAKESSKIVHECPSCKFRFTAPD